MRYIFALLFSLFFPISAFAISVTVTATGSGGNAIFNPIFSCARNQTPCVFSASAGGVLNSVSFCTTTDRLQNVEILGYFQGSGEDYNGPFSFSHTAEPHSLAVGWWGPREWYINGEFTATCAMTFDFHDLDCYQSPDKEHPILCPQPQGDPAYCAATQPAAQALLAKHQAECDSLGKNYSGQVVHQSNGDWCVEGECIPDTCPDGTNKNPSLQKKSVSSGNSGSFFPEEKNSDYDSKAGYSHGKPNLRYDALGRRTEPRPEAWRYLFEWKDKRNIYNRDKDFEWMGGNLFRLIFKGDTCGIKGVHYGIVAENGRLEGGYYCRYLEMDVHNSKYNWSREVDYDNLCEENDKLINATLTYKYKPVIATDSIFYMRKGDVFTNNYKTTKQNEIDFRKHELRHQKDTRKIISSETEREILINKVMCKSEFCAWKIGISDSLTKDRINFYNAKIDSASAYFHDQCYNYGNCD